MTTTLRILRWLAKPAPEQTLGTDLLVWIAFVLFLMTATLAQ